MTEGKLLLRLWNHKTKTATVTQNLAFEMKPDTAFTCFYLDTVDEKNNNLHDRVDHWDLH